MKTPDPAHAVLTPEQMSQADHLAIQGGAKGMALMQAAGEAVVQALVQRWSVRPVLVACGPGNNGGDGFVVARLLQQAGWPVTVALYGKHDALQGDAAYHASLWAGPVVPLHSSLLNHAELVVDALFGAGLARPLTGLALEFVSALARSHLPVCAVDVPSGLDGATGKVRGAAAAAELTVTFFRLKPGHLLLPGRSLCGHVVLADIGLPSSVLDDIKPVTYRNHPDHWIACFPRPSIDAHKYQRGHALVVGGQHLTGAARLAARACARAGAGLVTLAVPASAWAVYASSQLGAMVQALSDADDLQPALSDARRSLVLLGPGAGASARTRSHVLQALTTGRLAVLDADALSAFENDPETLVAAVHMGCVLTPHDGEFYRVFPGLSGSRLQRARAAARLSGAVVVLKGADTVVAWPDGTAFINDNAPPTLATGGTGDVLAGFVAGLAAQGMMPGMVAAAAVWLHGECARLFGPGVVAEDLPELLPRVVRRLLRPTSFPPAR